MRWGFAQQPIPIPLWIKALLILIARLNGIEQQLKDCESMQQEKLTVAGLVQDLVSDQRLSAADAKLFAAGVRQSRTKMNHPIELIDAAGLTDMANPAQTLTAETLMLWLSKRSDLSYYRVDPLKIDTPLVTRVMSGEFARRHQILAVEVNAREILILCSMPLPSARVISILSLGVRRAQPGSESTAFCIPFTNFLCRL